MQKTEKLHKIITVILLACLMAVMLFTTSTFAYETEQCQLVLKEQKIISPVFGIVGRVLVPEGWDVEVYDFSLGVESITWPHSVYVVVSSPDDDCVLTYVSKREFQQQYYSTMGYETMSSDDAYDYGTLMHMLYYRNAQACCDYMCLAMYGNLETEVVQEYTFDEAEQKSIDQASEKYQEEMQKVYDQAADYGVDFGELKLCEATAAKRKYQNANGELIIYASSCGFGTEHNFLDSISDTIIWDMPAVYGICATDVDQYEELFDMFRSVTTVSQEYNDMCSKTAERLVQEYLEIQNGTLESYSIDDNSSYSDITDDTIETGDTYSAFEAWDDYIKDETDYTTGTGEHVKVDMSYDHVFELDDGSILATNSLNDIPEGSTELSPTEIGQ